MPFICSIKPFMFIMAAICSAAMLGACAREAAQEPAETMTVDVDFREVHRCSRISPEITVAYAPRGTKFYAVRLVENGREERFLGGGKWVEDGTGIIPEGGLTQHYSGPCPPRDREVEYTYIVAAMADENSVPLAVVPYRFTPE